jgi:hypothetical protein
MQPHPTMGASMWALTPPDTASKLEQQDFDVGNQERDQEVGCMAPAMAGGDACGSEWGPCWGSCCDVSCGRVCPGSIRHSGCCRHRRCGMTAMVSLCVFSAMF